jgi:hypothetical protein
MEGDEAHPKSSGRVWRCPARGEEILEKCMGCVREVVLALQWELAPRS